MAQIRVPNEKLKGGFPALPQGTYTFRFDGFEPKMSSNQNNPSVNLWPKLTIINHPTLNGRYIPSGAMNSQAGWEHIDFVHALGVDMAHDGDSSGIPGPNGSMDCFTVDQSDPDNVEKWKYNGPLLGQVGKCEVVNVPHYQAAKAQAGQIQDKVLKYYCRLQGCTHEHRESLL